jgi:hypothetical protein
MLPSAVPDRHYFTENDERECGAGPMPSVEIEARNAVDGRIYRAVIVPKRQSIDYVTQPAVGAGPEQRQMTVTLTATAERKSLLGRKRAPVLTVCYGIGRLEFDRFCAVVEQMLAGCDFATGSGSRMAIDDICARNELIPIEGKIRSERQTTPLIILFDREASARGY